MPLPRNTDMGGTGERKCGSARRRRPFEETYGERMSLLKSAARQGRRIHKNDFVAHTSTLPEVCKRKRKDLT